MSPLLTRAAKGGFGAAPVAQTDLDAELDAAESGVAACVPAVERVASAPPRPATECALCGGGFGTRQAYRAAGCLHTYHRSCFEEHLTKQIHAGAAAGLSCPECPRRVSLEEMRQVLPVATVRRYERVRRASSISLHPNHNRGFFAKPTVLQAYLSVMVTLSVLLLTFTAFATSSGAVWAPRGPGGSWSVAAAACVASATLWALLRKVLFRGASGDLLPLVAAVCAASTALGALLKRALVGTAKLPSPKAL